MTNRFYTYQEHYPDCYSLHRPDGTDFCFLQGDNAREFEVVLVDIYAKEYPSGIFESPEQLLSAVIDQYNFD